MSFILNPENYRLSKPLEGGIYSDARIQTASSRNFNKETASSPLLTVNRWRSKPTARLLNKSFPVQKPHRALHGSKTMHHHYSIIEKYPSDSDTAHIAYPPPGQLSPTLSLPGLADLLLALEPELLALPGAIPLISNTLREMLLEVIDAS
jgi:hypothetical protein